MRFFKREALTADGMVHTVLPETFFILNEDDMRAERLAAADRDRTSFLQKWKQWRARQAEPSGQELSDVLSSPAAEATTTPQVSDKDWVVQEAMKIVLRASHELDDMY